MKKTFALLLAVLFAASSLLLASCSNEAGGGSDGSVEAQANLEKKATEIILQGSTATCDSSHVYVGEDGKISVQGAGTYLVSGTLDNGQIYVDCVDAGTVTLILKDAHITNENGACIHIKKTQEAVITLYDGTTSTLKDGTVRALEVLDLGNRNYSVRLDGEDVGLQIRGSYVETLEAACEAVIEGKEFSDLW